MNTSRSPHQHWLIRACAAVLCASIALLPARLRGNYPVGESFTLFTGAPTLQFQVIDINGDTYPDIIALVRQSVIIRFGTPTPKVFQDPYSIPIGIDGHQLIITDINNDTRLDIVTNDSDFNAWISLATGSPGQFAAAVRYAPNLSPSKLHVADVNGDGLKDLTFAFTGGYTVLWNAQSSPFSTSTYFFDLLFNFDTTTVFDINNDSISDLLAKTPSGLICRLGSTSGPLTSLLNVVLPAAPSYVGRINSDPIPDYVVGDQVYYGLDAAGHSTPGPKLEFSNGVSFAQDATGDQKADLFFNSTAGGTIPIAINRGTDFGGIGFVNTLDSPYEDSRIITNVIFRDVTGDGLGDIIIDDNLSTGSLRVFPGNASIGTWPVYQPTLQLPYNAVELQAADLNGDSIPDAACYGSSTTGLTLFLSDGTKPLATSVTVETRSANVNSPGSLDIGDLNHDNHPDIVLAKGNGVVSIALGNGLSSTVSSRTDYDVAPAGLLRNITIYDVDNDNQPDLVCYDTVANATRIFYGDGSGNIGQTSQSIPSTGTPFTLADLNGDGFTDIVTNNTSGTVALFGSGSARSFRVGQVLNPNGDSGYSFASVSAVGDVNGDGLPDVVTADYRPPLIFANPFQFGVYIMLGTGVGTWAPPAVIPFRFPLTALKLADLNADGKLDIIANSTYSFVVFPTNTSTTGFAAPAYLPNSSFISGRFSLADFTRDGVPDIAQADRIRGIRILALPDVCSDKFTCFVERQYLDFLKRPSDTTGLNYYKKLLCSATITPETAAANFLTSPEFFSNVGFAARCYLAIFNNNATTPYTSPAYRIPDYAGLNYWADVARYQGKLAVVSGFASSGEWSTRVGNRDNPGYVDFLYENILGRAADSAGKSYWVSQLDTGRNRNEVALLFIDSSEAQASYSARVNAVMAYVGFLNRAAEPAGFAYHAGRLESGVPLATFISGFITSSEYINRLLGLGCVWPPE